jgi:DNA helicase IV
LAQHPDLATEQAYLEHAYQCLENARLSAARLESMVEVGRGGTEQARYERDVIWDTILSRLRELDLGDASLVFGRIDREANNGCPGDRFYIGRLAVADEHQEPVVVDWRAPVAEPFYRATGVEPMGLVLRRHFATKGRKLLAIEDELFGDSAVRLGVAPDGTQLTDDGNSGADAGGATSGNGSAGGNGLGPGASGPIQGRSALIAALEEARTGRLGDIVATIQGEQDEIIRSPLPGILVVQGGPGTGKTVVALHRAAYLLYTHRFPLEGQGVLVVGPNRLFLGYIEHVLPSLGEAGVELAVLADLLTEPVTVRGYDRADTARVKGDLRMAKVVAKAVRDRRRVLRAPIEVGFGLETLRVTVPESEQILADARRRARTHNAGRRYVEQSFYEVLARSSRQEDLDPNLVRDRVRSAVVVREALEWMWPVLTPAELLHDLFGSRALIRLASGRTLTDAEQASLARRRSATVEEAVFSFDDVPLLDEARSLLGPRPRRKGRPIEDDGLRTYGHIVVDEAQDLSPMQLRLLSRRSLSGSMTIVGDIAQSTGAWAHDRWDQILAHLPDRKPARRAELTVGYRIPEQNMALANKVLAVAAPDLRPPRAIRAGTEAPRIVQVPPSGPPTAFGDEVAAVARAETEAVAGGTVAIIVPNSLLRFVTEGLDRAGLPYGQATRHGLDQPLTVVPVSLVKGLEVDASVVVEPAAVLEEASQGLRALYVALTRATKRLAVVHARPLPDFLAD